MKTNLYLFKRVLFCSILSLFFAGLAQAQDLSINSITIGEETAFATFSVKLSAPSSSTVKVDYSLQNGSAVSPDDFESVSGTLTFPANSTAPQTFKVPLKEDFEYEGDQTFYAYISNAVGANISVGQGSCTIRDNDALVLVPSYGIEVQESAGSVSVPVSLSQAVPYEVTVDYNTIDWSGAVAGTDYVAKSGKLTFPANSTEPQIITITILNDTEFDANEGFGISLSNAVKASLQTTSLYISIVDDEVRVDLAGSGSFQEGSNALIPVTLSRPVPYEVRVNYVTADQNALAGQDYTAVSGTLTFPPNSTAPQTISVPLLDDNVFNSSRYFTVNISDPVSATIGNATSYVYINDNDVTISLSSSVSASEQAGVAVINAYLSAPVGKEVTVKYTTSDNNAIAGEDYTASTGTITFPPNTTGPVSFTIPVINDNIYDPYESFIVTLSDAVNATILYGTVYPTIEDNDTQIITTSSTGASENAGTLKFDVYLSIPVNYPITVDYATADNTALAGQDYTTTSGTLTFPANSIGPQTITVPITDDFTYDPNESFLINLSNASGGSIQTTTNYINIFDNDVLVNLNTSVLYINESDGSARVIVSLSNKVDHEVRVDYATVPQNAVSPDDFTSTSGTLVFPANSAVPQAITVPIIDDRIPDSGESFNIELRNVTGASIGTGIASVIVSDREAMLSILAGGNINVRESDGTAKVMVGLEYAVPYEVKVNYSVGDGSAVAGSDYTPVSGTLTFPANSIEPQIVSVPVLADGAAESDEYFVFTLSNAVDAQIVTSQASINITEQSTQPAIFFNAQTAYILESIGNDVLSVGLTHPSAVDVKVNYVTSNGSAEDGKDYTFTAGTLTFPAGSVGPLAITVPILDDKELENDQYYQINLSGATNATLSTTTSYRYIVDNEATINLDQMTLSVSESSGNAELSARLSKPVPYDVTVKYETQNGWGAIAGEDFTAVSGTLTFPANSVEPQIVTIPIINDTQLEGQEIIYFRFFEPENAAIGNGDIGVSIVDDEATMSFGLSTYVVSEGDGQAQVNVTISQPVGQDVTVNYTTNSGGATGGSDYTEVSGTLTFPANSITPQKIAIPILEDVDSEPDEYFTVTLSDPTNATLNGYTSTSVLIRDNDAFLNMDLTNVRISESAGTATLAVTLSRPVDREIKVDYATSDGSAVGGEDYNPTSGTLTFPANSTSPQIITIPLVNNSVFEYEESFNVTLSNPVNASIQNQYASVSILDDDATISIEPGYLEIQEGNAATFTVRLSQAVPMAVTVDYTTSNSSAIAGEDYSETTGTLTFPANSLAPISFTVPTIDDKIYDPNEQFSVTLSNASNAVIQTSTSYASIVDNDAVLAIEPQQYTNATEASGKATFTVTISRAVPYEVKVNYTTTEQGNSTPGQDYTVTTGTLTFPANSSTPQSFNVPVIDDGLYEQYESLIVELNNPVNASIDGRNRGYAYLIDDDPKISIAPIAVSESGGSANFQVTLSDAVPFDVTVNYKTAGGTATEGTDYEGKTGTVNFPANTTSQTLSIPLKDDFDFEDNETFTVTLLEPANGFLGTASAVGTINDNDLRITYTPPALTVSCAGDVPAPSASVITVENHCSDTPGIVVSDVISPGFTCANRYTLTRTWTVTNTCGNNKTTTQIITVDDQIAPVIAGTPATLNVKCAADVPAASIGAVTATDNCSGNVTVTVADVVTPGSCVNRYSIVRTWTATDVCGNKSTSSQIINVNDDVAPVIAGTPANLTVTCAADVPAAAISAVTATDNCTGTVTVTVADVVTPGSCTNKYSIKRTWTATDVCGNQSTSQQTITVDDNIAPVISGTPAAITVSCAADVPAANITGITATDNCSGTVTITVADQTAPGSCANKFVITRTWTATDICGNKATSTQIITVNDNVAPVITACIANQTFNTEADKCTYTLQGSSLAPTATDNCSPAASLTFKYTLSGVTTSTEGQYSSIDGITFNKGVTTVSVKAYDACGNESIACSFTVTVSDKQAPATPTLAAVNSQCAATVTAPTTTDNCDVTITGTTTDPLTYTEEGSYSITWTFTDASGNKTTATQAVIVEDATPPVKPVLADVTGECTVSPSVPTTTDNCAGTLTGTTSTVFPITKVGTTIVTWRFDDGHGNVTEAEQNVIVTGSDEIATTSTTSTVTFNAETNQAYDDNCQLIADIIPIALTGEVTSSVWIESAPVNGPYVSRHYQISPANNPETASATITLYFTQAEFDAYNAVAQYRLPRNAEDKIGKANLRIIKFSGNASDAGGLTYTGASTKINPEDANIVFVNGRWEITFPVEGFSGFFVNSENDPLPVTLLSFSGKKTSKSENALTWVTTDEKDFKGFEVQRSNNAVNFETIGWVGSQRNSETALRNYSFQDKVADLTDTYYRLKMVDEDGTFLFSKMINIENALENAIVGPLYPNPSVVGQTFVDVVSPKSGLWEVVVYNLSGQVVQSKPIQLKAGNNKIEIETKSLPLGSALIRLQQEGSKDVFVRKLTLQ